MFLTSLYNQGKGYSCIKLARSAVATLLFGSKISVGMHPLVKNLLEECLTEDQHSHGTLSVTWDVYIVFNFLKWSPAANLSLPQLTLKVVLYACYCRARGVRPYGCWIYATLLGQKTDIRCTFESISSRFPLQTDIRTNLCLEAFLKINLCVWCTTCVTIRKELVL